MKNFNLKAAAAVAAGAMAFASCSQKAVISGAVADAPESEVVVRLLNINRYEVLDTLTTDAAGRFSYKMDIAKGQPEFVYLFYKDTKIASLLLERGDRVTVTADTTGVFSVAGSEETERLIGVEKDYADFSARFLALSEKLDPVNPASPESKAASSEITKEYISYYRDRLRYVMSNPHSMTVIPVFFQMVAPNMPLFSQNTDAIHFSSVCDSLETVYPDSRYVKALRTEADRRTRLMELNMRLSNAEELAYPDIELPDVNGRKVRLSGLDDKVVIVHFWTSTDAAQKMFNQDVMKPIYRDYHRKGLEIYQVALDVDKAAWARTVRDQDLEWINVCDGLGSASPSVASYNVRTLPASFILSGGELVPGKVSDESSLRSLLDRLL